MNDCWPVASWSSLDYHGRWKALHYLARRFFAPLIISGVEDGARGTVAVHVTSDQLAEEPGEVYWLVTTVHGETVADGRLPLTIPALADCFVADLELRELAARFGVRDLLLWLELYDSSGRLRAENLITLARPKHLALAGPQIEMAFSTTGGGTITAVTVAAKRPALWAWLEAEENAARFSDNFFHLRPGRPVTILVEGANGLQAGGLSVRSLVDTYRLQAA